MQTKVAPTLIRELLAPGVRPFIPVGRSVGRPMKLRLGRQGLAYPCSIGKGLLVGHIDRPVERQRNFPRHRAPEPLIGSFGPEVWWIGAGSDKFEVLLIGNLILADRKSWDRDDMGIEFIVPPKSCPTCAAQSRRPGRYVNHGMHRGGPGIGRTRRPSQFPVL